MFNLFRRRRPPAFDLAAIGDHWVSRPITHDGIAGTLRIRELPAGLDRGRFPVVALAWSDGPLSPDAFVARSSVIQGALEADATCLLVLTHQTPERATWYAYAGSSPAIDSALSALGDARLRWGTNDDPEWAEYDNARHLAGA